ncbi:hypothetical protein PFICI_13739 [Pestalotiopsis fici W106-1]|uniref:Uncharacterized protein n=1 Tax=Pestalotiopsis fici (strain W106-1 / CGMCC3.15140) TaxID=1229662 RepID=W3WMY4_PESFW|nr:uncharacterized protein PFICI_13739 [Pestalotiopsis fici W106-1]ETS75255.1 hypothetical protein PFICI_13739 [Pestalotiopsis fici W106-1]
MKDDVAAHDMDDPLVDSSTGFFKQFDTGEDPEEDLEHQVIDGEPIEQRVEEDEQEEATEHTQIPYEVAARAFMEIIFHGTMSQNGDWKNNPSQCHLCLEDETISAEQKAHTYNKEEHLKNHMGSFIHTPLAPWCRQVEAQAEADHCPIMSPYCAEPGHYTCNESPRATLNSNLLDDDFL